MNRSRSNSYFFETFLHSLSVFVEFIFFLSHRIRKSEVTSVLLEAGTKGWESVFYSELQNKFTEVFPDSIDIIASVINREESYLRQNLKSLRVVKPSWFIYDPRTGSQRAVLALLESFILKVVLSFYRVRVATIITDYSVRQWRFQGSLMSGKSGIVFTFMPPNLMSKFSPNHNVFGPMLMPVSDHTIEKYSNKVKKSQEIIFRGSLYSDRLTFLEEINSRLMAAGERPLSIKDKLFESTAEDYWDEISSNAITFTTTFQVPDPRFQEDGLNINQLVFRISEGLAMKSLVICTPAPGLLDLFQNHLDLVVIQSPQEAADAISFFQKNITDAQQVASNGHLKFRRLMNSKSIPHFLLQKSIQGQKVD